MTYPLTQNSFAGGEISPALHGRTDWERYGISLKDCRNFMVIPCGVLRNRPGTKYIGSSIVSTVKGRLIPFSYSTEQTYVLEFGDKCFRVFANSALCGTEKKLADLSSWAGGTTYSSGQYVKVGTAAYVSRAGTNLNHAPATSPTWWLPAEFNSEGYVAIVIITPWPEADLPLLKYTQSADVLTVCHPDYPPCEDTRTTATSWTHTEISFVNGPFDETNTDTSMTVYASAATGTAVTLTGAVGKVLFEAEDVGKLFLIKQKDAGQSWEPLKAEVTNNIRRANGKYWVALTTADTGTDRPGDYDEDALDDWHDGGVNWRFLHPGFGIAEITVFNSAESVTCSVISRIPDATAASGGKTYKWAKGSWNDTNGYPGCTTYHQQRHVFAGSPADPQTVWASRTGDYPHFGISSPIQDDDVLIYPLTGRKVNSVRHIQSIGDALIAFTSDSIISLSGSDNQGVLTPTTVQSKPQGFLGVSDLFPLLVGNTALYVQDKGQSIHDLIYDYASNSYTGDDLSVFVPHLLEGFTIVDWAYQCVPYSIIWAVRSDGALLGLTYMRSQKVVAWHRHDTCNGLVEAICVVSEGDEDAVYLLVKRTINGSDVRYIERMASRQFDEIEDAFFVDCGLTYDGWNAAATTITVSGGTIWDHGEEVLLSASVATFTYPAQTDVGDEIRFLATDGTRYSLVIRSTGSTGTATAMPNKILPAAYRNVARTDWGFAHNTMTGLGHLEGETVSILSDGNVEEGRVVESGEITLDRPGCFVHVGLPIQSDIALLDLSVAGAETIRDKEKNVASVSVQIEESRGLWVGQDSDTLIEWKQRDTESLDLPIQPYTGLAEIDIQSDWGKSVNLFIRQDDPLPLSILSIIANVEIGGK